MRIPTWIASETSAREMSSATISSWACRVIRYAPAATNS